MNRSRKRLKIISLRNLNPFRARANALSRKLKVGAVHTSILSILKKKKRVGKTMKRNI